MKSCSACALALVRLSGPAWALPRPSLQVAGTNAGFPSRRNGENDNGKGVHVSKTSVMVGGALVGVVAVGAALRQRRINKLEQTVAQSKVKINQLLKHRESMEQQLGRRASSSGGIREIHCTSGGYHSRPVEARWFEEFGPAGTVQVRRPSKRATAWAESEGKGQQAAEAPPRERGHYQAQVNSLFSMVPHWAERTFAAVAARARQFPAYSHLMQKEALLLKEEAAAMAY
ncbi:MAG: hypothetical protein M1826_006782 [Phylliscum demangeonii]|nr:MAG: hypothetical protein M1826_006782 [Phylliscum demangeonii]